MTIPQFILPKSAKIPDILNLLLIWIRKLPFPAFSWNHHLQYLSSLPFQHHTSQLGKWQVAQRGTVAQCFKSLHLKSVDLKSNRSGQGVKGNKNLKVKKGGISRCQVCLGGAKFPSNMSKRVEINLWQISEKPSEKLPTFFMLQKLMFFRKNRDANSPVVLLGGWHPRTDVSG